jgi:hypothetical protein
MYGWSEGSWHGKRLRRALIEASYEITTNPETADVIIAHSGGCFMLPRKTTAKLVILVGLPYWPDKHPLQGTREKIKLESKDFWWYKKSLFNAYYLISKPVYSIKMNKERKKLTLPKYQEATVLLLRNEHDTYMHSGKSQLLAEEKNWKFKQLKGQHDDLWLNPAFYIACINKYSKT